jgi:hypothetical protein
MRRTAAPRLLTRQAKLLRQGRHQLFGRQVGLLHPRHGHGSPAFLSEGVQNRRFSDSGLTCQGDDPVAVAKRRSERIEHGPRLSPQEQEFRVRAEPEWQFLKLEPVRIHDRRILKGP